VASVSAALCTKARNASVLPLGSFWGSDMR
jgi:hypothetical protein